MEKKIVNLNIITPEGKVFEDDASMVIAPAIDGEVGIMPLHSPYICALTYGALRIKKEDNGERVFAVSKGYMEVLFDKVSVIVSTAEAAHAIDIYRAEAAKERAEQELAKTEKKEEKIFELASADLQRALNRIKIGNKYRQ